MSRNRFKLNVILCRAQTKVQNVKEYDPNGGMGSFVFYQDLLTRNSNYTCLHGFNLFHYII